jgi:hypothetical protein
MKRTVLAGLVGGIVMFLWGAFAHMVLPVGHMGLRSLPNDEAVMGAMKESIPEPGLYMFPGMADDPQHATEEQMAAWEQKVRRGPVGLLLFDPAGTNPMSPSQLIGELISDILAAFVVAYFLVRMTGSLLTRALAGAVLGLFAWLTVSYSYLNWYRFPAPFIFAEMIDQVVGWGLAGLTIAALAKPGRR